MGNPKTSKRTLISAGVLFFFSVTFLTPPIPAEAQIPVNKVPGFTNPLAAPLQTGTVPANAVRLERRTKSETLQVLLDPVRTERIHSITKTIAGQKLSLLYIYAENTPIVTLLMSLTAAGEKPSYTQYFRYALGEKDSLALVLEEGWVRNSILYPSKVYDYFDSGLQIRYFDRAGSLLKIESSEGVKNIFVYSRYGELIALKQVDPKGAVAFYSQVPLAGERITNPAMPYLQSLIGILSNSVKVQKRLETLFLRKHEPSLNLSQTEGAATDQPASSFLAWLEAAYPVRAGPLGGEKT